MHIQKSGKVTLEIDPAIVAAGAQTMTARPMFTAEPWRDPTVPRLRAWHSDRRGNTPAEYRVAIQH